MFAQRALPFALHLFRHFGVAIARQGQPGGCRLPLEQVDQLGALGVFTGARQAFWLVSVFQRAGFTGVGTAGKGDFSSCIPRQMANIGCAGDEMGRMMD